LKALRRPHVDQRAAHVLGDVIGIGARSGELPGQAVDAVVMGAEQPFERGAIAGAIGVIFLIAGDVLSVWHVIWTVLATAGLFAGIQLLIGSNEEIVEVEETVAVVD
jgi:hypothetical protein